LWALIGAAHGVSRIVRQALFRHSALTGNGGAAFLEVERQPEVQGRSMPLAGDGAIHLGDGGGQSLLAFLDDVRTRASRQRAQEGDDNRRATRGTTGHGNSLVRLGGAVRLRLNACGHECPETSGYPESPRPSRLGTGRGSLRCHPEDPLRYFANDVTGGVLPGVSVLVNDAVLEPGRAAILGLLGVPVGLFPGDHHVLCGLHFFLGLALGVVPQHCLDCW